MCGTEPFIMCPHGANVRVNNGQCILVQQLLHQGISEKLPWAAVRTRWSECRMSPREKLEIFLKLDRDFYHLNLGQQSIYEKIASMLEEKLRDLGCPKPRMRGFRWSGFASRITEESECMFNVWTWPEYR